MFQSHYHANIFSLFLYHSINNVVNYKFNDTKSCRLYQVTFSVNLLSSSKDLMWLFSESKECRTIFISIKLLVHNFVLKLCLLQRHDNLFASMILLQHTFWTWKVTLLCTAGIQWRSRQIAGDAGHWRFHVHCFGEGSSGRS